VSTERIGGSVGSGYTPCACRDCMDTAIGDPGNALCHACRDAGCSNDGDAECSRADAYGVEEEPTPPACWLITSITDIGRGAYYRFQIEGENLNFAPGENGRRISWSVRDIADPQYAAHPDATPEVRAAVDAAKQIGAAR
jgi:hypothetical protein